MYRIKAWKRVKQALTACAETFAAASRDLVLGKATTYSARTGEDHPTSNRGASAETVSMLSRRDSVDHKKPRL